MSKERKIAACLELADGCVRDARLLLSATSRNAAYIASQAAEHVITAIATSEDVHIERRHAHQLDTLVRMIPKDNPDRKALGSISFLEAYATSYRYGTPTGRIAPAPRLDQIETSLAEIDTLIATLRRHFGISPTGNSALRVSPRR